jgi:hypothetical protein
VAQPISPSRLSGEGAEVGDALVFDGENYSPVPIEIAQADWDATSGAAQILNKPTLGTAAATAATDYATAAQGAKADSALQPDALTPYRTSEAQDIIDAGKEPTITTLPISKGGTGATTAEQARINLGSGLTETIRAEIDANALIYAIAL